MGGIEAEAVMLGNFVRVFQRHYYNPDSDSGFRSSHFNGSSSSGRLQDNGPSEPTNYIDRCSFNNY